VTHEELLKENEEQKQQIASMSTAINTMASSSEKQAWTP